MKNDDVYLAASVMSMVFMGVILLGILVCMACLPISKIIREIGNFFDSPDRSFSLLQANPKAVGNAVALAAHGVKHLKKNHVRTPHRFPPLCNSELKKRKNEKKKK
jgi:hypothetical protein